MLPLSPQNRNTGNAMQTPQGDAMKFPMSIVSPHYVTNYYSNQSQSPQKVDYLVEFLATWLRHESFKDLNPSLETVYLPEEEVDTTTIIPFKWTYHTCPLMHFYFAINLMRCCCPCWLVGK